MEVENNWSSGVEEIGVLECWSNGEKQNQEQERKKHLRIQGYETGIL